MKRLLIWMFLMVCMSTQWAAASTGKLYTSDKMSSSRATHVFQDNYGYIWVATENGLNRFDGYRFTSYFTEPADTMSVPDNEATCFLPDGTDRLWVGFAHGLATYDYEHNSFRRCAFPGGIRPRVESLVPIGGNRVLVATAGYGVFVLDKQRGTLVAEKSLLRPDSAVEFVSNVFLDAHKSLWRWNHLPVLTRSDYSTGTARKTKDYQLACGPVIDVVKADAAGFQVVCMYGIMRYSYATDKLTDAGYDLSALNGSVSVRTAFVGHDGNLYLGTSGSGLMVIHKGSKRLERVDTQGVSEFDLASANVNDVLEDKDHNLWVSCYKKGLFQLSQGREAFNSWSFTRQNYRLGSSVSSIALGDNGDVWCTVQKYGVYKFDKEGRVAAHPAAPSGANTIYRDPDGHYWLCSENTLYSYNPLTGEAQARQRFEGWGLNCMTSDGKGTLYICSFGNGLYIYNTLTGDVQTKSMNQPDGKLGRLWNDWIKALCIDRKGRLWIGTSDGLSVMDTRNGNFRVMGWEQQLDNTPCHSLCELANGDMLIGTSGAGLLIYRMKSGKLERYPHTDELVNKSIHGIVVDGSGDIWMSSGMGIWQYDSRGQRLIGHLRGNGLSTREYILGAMLQEPGGRIVVGTNDGMTAFMPADVTGERIKMGDVFISGFLLNGKAVNPRTDRFDIPYDENAFVIEFSLFNYQNTEYITFQYRINEGEWTSAPEGQNSVSFTKMKPGTYHMEVRAMSNGVYSEGTRAFTVVVHGPWYSSTWAYLLYALMAAGLTFLLLSTYERRKKAEMEEAKMQFLINATHDIRSPLTLIMGALKKLQRMAGVGAADTDEATAQATPLAGTETKEALDTIDRNARRLMLLVNQILDERKLDKNQMQLHCSETNLVEFIAGVCSLYRYTATQRNINFVFEHEQNTVKAWIDRVNFDKVISNLLSNAFKFTPDGGEVKVVLSSDKQEAVIQVIDTGIGFKEEKTERLFERFYQGDNSRDVLAPGTGIGLNLSRAITQMHGGRIRAYNRTDGQQGACLDVRLPLGNAHLKPEQIAPLSSPLGGKSQAPLSSPQKEGSPSAQEASPTGGKATGRRACSGMALVGVPLSLQGEPEGASEGGQGASPKRQPSKNYHILVADDDEEVARYIKNELSPWYRFKTCPNGKEALKALLTGKYDLVVSDVMMPEMDGITLLKNIKSNPQVSDTPVILLTSRAEVADRLEGLKRGADAFLAKPFSMEELHVLIDNLVDNVRRLRGKFSGALIQEDKLEPLVVKGNNDALMERIMRFLNENLSNPDYSVEKLTEDVGISRAQLHRKMKEITGVSTGEFIRNLRIEQAARLIRENKVNVTQVAYTVGFSNQTHFSTVFKRYYGVSPSEYAQGTQPAPQKGSEPEQH